MVIRKVLLERFRIHTSLLLEFSKRTTVIVGQNASGKTAVIEALQLLATGNSFRAEAIAEMVSFERELGRIKGIVELEGSAYEGLRDPDAAASLESYELEVLLTRGVVQGKRTPFRLFSVNGVRRQKRTATGIFKVVSFRPEDLRLVEGSPSRRRDFLNMPLILLFPEYEQALSMYENILKRRNKLLEAVREGTQPKTALHYWNQGMLKHGSTLQQFRARFMATCSSVFFPFPFAVEYLPSLMTAERQAEYADREIAAGHTLIGPHKDDFIVTMPQQGRSEERLDVAVYGSRGQQRLAVLWLKTVELEYITAQTQEYPVLLLDDIMSELDSESRSLVTELLGKTQSIITTIDDAGMQLIVAAIGAENTAVIHFPHSSTR